MGWENVPAVDADGDQGCVELHDQLDLLFPAHIVFENDAHKVASHSPWLKKHGSPAGFEHLASGWKALFD